MVRQLHRAYRTTSVLIGFPSAISQERHNGARRTQVKLDGFWLGSVAPKRFWGVLRRPNVGFPMSNAIPHARPQCLSAYRNELESTSEIPTWNSRVREDGARAWPPDPVFAPPTRRTERPGDAPLRSRGPTRSRIPTRAPAAVLRPVNRIEGRSGDPALLDKYRLSDSPLKNLEVRRPASGLRRWPLPPSRRTHRVRDKPTLARVLGVLNSAMTISDSSGREVSRNTK